MKRERQSELISNTTVASNPGELRVQLSVFYRCFPRPAAPLACLPAAFDTLRRICYTRSFIRRATRKHSEEV